MGLEELIAGRARTLGFDLVGVTTLGPAETAPYFDAWVDAGYAGEMAYLPRGAEKRRDTRTPYPGVASAVVVGMNYGGTQPTGSVARYARGDDYHDVMTERLNELHRWIEHELGHSIRGKAYVDTGPVLERDLARRAGLGWFGKNTMLVNPTLGSFFFIGALLLELSLEADPPFEADRCGSCTRCLDACPTDALVAPRMMDATRCVSYLTIELRGPIPEPLRAGIGEMLYGCDICQDVCPWNVRFAQDVAEPRLAARTGSADPDPRALLLQSEDEFRARFPKSAMRRAKRHGLARNAAIALGNRGDPADTLPLSHAAEHDDDPSVRDAAHWALTRIRSRTS